MIPSTLDNDSKRSWFFFPFDLFVSHWYKHDLSLRESLILPLPFDLCLSSAFLPLISSFSHIAHLERATTCKQPTSGIDCLSSFENIHPLASCIDTAGEGSGCENQEGERARAGGCSASEGWGTDERRYGSAAPQVR
jgi:hypothetical protein